MGGKLILGSQKKILKEPPKSKLYCDWLVLHNLKDPDSSTCTFVRCLKIDSKS